jgi:hypothetical protein
MIQCPTDTRTDEVTSILRVVLAVALCTASMATVALVVMPFH